MWTPKKLVNQEVLVCLSSLISHLCKSVPDDEDLLDMHEVYDYDAAEKYLNNNNYHVIEYDPDCWAAFAQEDPWTEDYAEFEDSDKNQVIEDALDELCGSRITEHTKEVYEHWAVTSWLAKKLEDQGEKVVDYYGLNIFCRCYTGQSMYMDPSFIEIAKGMGWKPKDPYDFG